METKSFSVNTRWYQTLLPDSLNPDATKCIVMRRRWWSRLKTVRLNFWLSEIGQFSTGSLMGNGGELASPAPAHKSFTNYTLSLVLGDNSLSLSLSPVHTLVHSPYTTLMLNPTLSSRQIILQSTHTLLPNYPPTHSLSCRIIVQPTHSLPKSSPSPLTLYFTP